MFLATKYLMVVGKSRFYLGVARQRAVTSQAEPFRGFLLRDAVVANALRYDDARGFLRDYLSCTL